jgi:hypothetical protein
LLVKFTASLDVLDQASRKETDTDWVNFSLLLLGQEVL